MPEPTEPEKRMREKYTRVDHVWFDAWQCKLVNGNAWLPVGNQHGRYEVANNYRDALARALAKIVEAER